ncbi:DUF222 domain-containing protein [Kribbella sp. NPDC048928]|uniref:HNH endonuclease n=1 Tax=Kribbella sp. NPDC048928 TaxID=3364111 RepID=UPI003713F460
MDVLDGRPVWSLTDGEVLPAFDSVDAEIIRLQGIRLQLIARIEETGYAQELGARDSVELLSLRYRQDGAEAWRDVRLARALPKYNAVGTALTDGIELPAQAPDDPEAADEPEGADVPVVRPMRAAQAAVIVSELERVRSRVPVEDLDIAEAQLVQLAAHLSPSELRAAAKEICNLLDSDGPEPEENKAYERESLTLTNADLGVKFKGYLANENAELLRAVIHAGARPHKTTDGEQDPRPREKRQADALTTALTLAANAWDTTSAGPTASTEAEAQGTGANTASATEKKPTLVPGHGAKACITVTIDLQDLKAATATATGQTVYSDGLSAAAIRRLACDAKIIPIVLGSNSEPLDVGRQERLVTRAMRRALNSRDRGCVVCGAPPIMCDAHHLISWIDGGETKLDNLALLCRHHVDLHNGRWTITITNAKVHVTRPTWADPSPHHRPKPPPHHRSKPPPHPSPTAPTTPPAAPARPRPPTPTPADRPAPPDDPACPAPAADPQPPSSLPPTDPCGGTILPTATTSDDVDLRTTTTARTSRWKADAATYAEAARFAVWHPAPTDISDPPSFATI